MNYTDANVGNTMLLNSPLIPTITSNPDEECNVLNLKYTLPSGMIVYTAPTQLQAPVKATTKDSVNIAHDRITTNQDFLHVTIPNLFNIEYW